MSPVAERYHQGVENNASLLMPYYWIAISLFIGVIVGALTPIFPEIINIEIAMIVFGVGLFLPFVYDKSEQYNGTPTKIRTGSL